MLSLCRQVQGKHADSVAQVTETNLIEASSADRSRVNQLTSVFWTRLESDPSPKFTFHIVEYLG